MNPSLAAGSAAQAGSVVSRSSTNDVNFGAVLDNISALNQIKLQRQQTENARKENEILSAEAESARYNSFEKALEFASNLGNDVNVQLDLDKDGFMRPLFTWDGNPKNIKAMPIFEKLKNEVDYGKSTNEYLNRQLNWFVADKLMDITGTLGSVFMPKLNYKIK